MKDIVSISPSRCHNHVADIRAWIPYSDCRVGAGEHAIHQEKVINYDYSK